MSRGVEAWPPGTVLIALEDIVYPDWDGEGNQTVIRKGARGTVGRGDGGARVRLDKVDHACGSTIFDTVPLHRDYREKFIAVLPI